MFKKYALLFTLLLITGALRAQESKTLYERYLDFNLVRFEADNDVALEMGEALLDSADNLPDKSRISFYNSMAKLYEDGKQPGRATTYYEIVAKAVPNYYVAHRALGYLYLKPATDLEAQLNTTKKNTPAYENLQADYKTAALKALPHLEIAEACDPSEETLAIIKNLYKNMGDTAGLNSLPERLKNISKNCLDILSDN
jgi:hypothetical protein